MAWLMASIGKLGLSQKRCHRLDGDDACDPHTGILPDSGSASGSGTGSSPTLRRRFSTMSFLGKRQSSVVSDARLVSYDSDNEVLSGKVDRTSEYENRDSFYLPHTLASPWSLSDGNEAIHTDSRVGDDSDVLALLLRLSLAVCMADLVDCIAAVRTFLWEDSAALQRVATKICKELGSNHTAPTCVGTETTGSSSSLDALESVDEIISAFLLHQSGQGLAQVCGASALEFQLDSPEMLEGAMQSVAENLSREASTGLDDALSFEHVPGLERSTSLGSQNSQKYKRFQRSATSNTEISDTSFSEFAAKRKSFSFWSHPNIAGSKNQEEANADDGCALDLPSEIASSSQEYTKPALRNQRSFASNVTANSLASTHVSAKIRLMLRQRAEANGESIGDLEWAGDGTPRGLSFDPQQASSSKGLLERYKASPQGNPGLPISAAAQESSQSPSSSSLMMFVMSTAHKSATSAERLDASSSGPTSSGTGKERKEDGTNSWPTSGSGESTATSVLLDNARQGMDDEPERALSKYRRPRPKGINTSTPEKECMESEGGSKKSSRKSSPKDQRHHSKRSSAQNRLGDKSGAAGGGGVEAPPDAAADWDDAMERWRQRKTRRIQARKQVGKITYGDAIRNEHEQNLKLAPPSVHATPEETPQKKAPCASTIETAGFGTVSLLSSSGMPAATLGARRFRTHDGVSRRAENGVVDEVVAADDGMGSVVEAFLAMAPGGFRTHDGSSTNEWPQDLVADPVAWRLALRQQLMMLPMDFSENSRRAILQLQERSWALNGAQVSASSG